MRTRCVASLAVAVLLLAACDCGEGGSGSGGTCTASIDCPVGELCVDGTCVAGGADAGRDGAASDGGCVEVCAAECCVAGELCLGDASCVEDLGPCGDDDDCPNDGWCETTIGRCVPYGEGRDVAAECGLLLEPGVFRTSVECEWTTPPAGDPYPSHVHVESTPLVVDFAIDRGPDDAPRPSIVFVATDRFTYVDGGVVRIIDGTTCEQQATLADPFVQAAGTPAVGDLNGDRRPDVVSAVEGGGIAAWGWNDATRAWERLFRSADTSASSIHSLSIADVDGDGSPEILAGGLVYAADGTLASGASGEGDITCTAYVPPAVVADVDLDGAAEVVQGTAVRAWDGATSELVREPYSAGGAAGFVAVADFGDFDGVDGDAPGRPEVVVVTRGRVQVQTIHGVPVFGPVPLPGAGDGGNPTVADFDGDGVPEIGAGGPGSYTVFDLACVDGGGPGECGSARTDGILWTQPVQDTSCGINGSTVFDFEGDGRAEVVYGDECFVRVFDGGDGTVVWSHRRSSGTWIEAPVVADVDGDFHAELVSGSNDVSAPSCPAVDPIFAGLRCTASADCPTAASSCDEGLCRCTADTDCGDPDLSCTAPLTGSAGSGNVCRPSWSRLHGVRVYSDVRDRWAGSRSVWNQHAYAVTNVEDDGTIPTAAAMRRNWATPGLNNFRQNVQGDLAIGVGPDLTVRGTGFGRDCTEDDAVLPLEARVCSRGLLGVGAGATVTFYDGDPAAGGTEVCRTATTRALSPGECETVSCTWTDPPTGVPLDVYVRVDVGDEVAECYEGNNLGTVPGVQCPPPLD